MADRLVRARAEFLRATLGPVTGLDRGDVAASFRGVSAGLLQARMTARAVAVDTVIDRGRDQLARAIGVDLGWEFVDRSRWLGPDVRAAFAARLAGTADWLGSQQAAGVDPEALVARVTYWQQQVAGSDVHRVAREVTLEVAGGNPAMGRVMRVAEPDACDWCEAMATRAAVYYSEDTALAAGHANCQCDVETVTDPRMVTYLREQGAIAWQRSGLVGQPILRGQRAARFPRTDPALTVQGAVTPQRLAAIDAQLAGYEQRLAAGRGTDWMRTQVTALREERRVLADQVRTSATVQQRGAAVNRDASMTAAERATVARLDAHTASLVLDERSAAAIAEYQEGGHRLLNRVLWEAPESLQRLSDLELGRVRRMRTVLDYLLGQATSPGVTVWRGVPQLRDLRIDLLEAGDLLAPHKGFTSTSVARSVAEGFIAEAGVLFELDVPAGTAGLWLPRIGSPRWAWQEEFLLARGARILVTGIRRQGGLTVIAGEVR